MKQDSLQQWSMATEVFLSLVKWFILFTVLNNLVWAIVHFHYVNKSFSEEPTTTIKAVQETTTGDNTITNGVK